MKRIRRSIPARTCKKVYSTYRSYKPYLKEDFNSRCGYCDADDRYSGGVRAYQIDHFAPKQLFPELTNTYSNLVYACLYCNNSKSNHWPSTTSDKPVVGSIGFIDPCSEIYDLHLKRDSSGKIVAITPLGEYMHSRLNLHLLRHSILWMLDELKVTIIEVSKILAAMPNTSPKLAELNDKYTKLLKEYFDYTQIYHGTL